MREITFEITDYCRHHCAYCSSRSVDDSSKAHYLSAAIIHEHLKGKGFDRINISGGEPLAHPAFYKILRLCEEHTDDVVVYSNAIKHLIYNAHVIDGVYLEANLTVLPEVDKIHILRRVKQGREADRPEVHLSRNFREACSCDHYVVRPSGEVGRTPCDKWQVVHGQEYILEEVDVIWNPKVTEWCKRPYPRHPKGCPMYGNRPSCPPEAPMINEVMDLGKQTFIVATKFDVAAHYAQMREKHPDWSEAKVRCVLYWQGSAKKRLREAVRSVLDRFAEVDLITLYRPEAHGVNVAAMMRKIGISLDFPPKEWAYQVALIGFPLRLTPLDPDGG